MNAAPEWPLVRVTDLTKHFPLRTGLMGSTFSAKRFVQAVNKITFSIAHNEALGLVGESGCGKSTTGKLIARLVSPTSGSIELDGSDWLALKGAELRRRRREVQVIFQNPFMSLDPRWKVESIVAEPLVTHGVVPKANIRARVGELLDAVGLDPANARRYPHQFSGGQRQRIGLARALAAGPRLLIADEAVSALDVSVQAQVLNLLKQIRRQFELSMLFISHDLSVVKYVCDRVAVMYLGRLVEIAPTRDIFGSPKHPYTKALLAAVPQPTPRAAGTIKPLAGEVPSPVSPPEGCAFHPRCERATSLCREQRPELRSLAPNWSVACHHADEAQGD